MEKVCFYVLILWILWNAAVFAMYGIDKHRAVCGKWRISEFTLIAAAFLMGSPGAACGMEFFHHKTRKIKFRLLVPAAFLFNCLVILFAMKEI